MSAPNWPAIVAAAVSIGGMISIAAGHPALAAVFSDPNTATLATAAVTAIGGLVSAFTAPVHKGGVTHSTIDG
jgi:hypothetical protein